MHVKTCKFERFYREKITESLLNANFDPAKYKQDVKEDWNERAAYYHEHYVIPRVGPFQSTATLLQRAGLREGDRVLDIATGTGIVAKEALKKVGERGRVVGIDISPGPLGIARREVVDFDNIEFIEMDAEDLKFPDDSFDAIVSQFALFFFPDTQKALREMRRVLKNGGKLAVSVHGSQENVPYFTSIRSSILHYIPDIRPAGSPDPFRFGNPEALAAELENADLKNVQVQSYTYTYNAGSFYKYWNECMQSTASAIRRKLEAAGSEVLQKIKEETREKAEKYLKEGKLHFPWEILIASASN